jgi:glycolate oxidase FAD binding subunit
VKPATPPINIDGAWLLDWGGAQRWLYSDEDVAVIRHRVAQAGGQVTVFRNNQQSGKNSPLVFPELSGPLLAIHQRLKASFDPKNIFNRGRLYANL